MKIAWFTPFNPRSAVGAYSAAIAHALAETDEVIVCASEVGSPEQARPTTLPLVCLPATRQHAILRLVDDCDLAVYNMGDYAPYHKAIYDVALKRPGLVVLHDLVMRDFFNGYCLDHLRDSEALVQILAYCHGAAGERHARDFLAGRRPDA